MRASSEVELGWAITNDPPIDLFFIQISELQLSAAGEGKLGGETSHTMATPNTEKAGASTDDPGALEVDRVLREVSQNDEEEWEYEYSSTETEVYYLTLELSYSEFKDQPAKVPHHSRGGYYKNWLDQYSDDPTIKATKFGLNQEDQSEHENDNENDNDDGAIPEPEEDDDMQNLDPMLRGNPPDDNSRQKQKKNDKGKGIETVREREEEEEQATERNGKDPELKDEELENIQILELHSHNPIISYRGRVFEGQWAEVIGTEAIFANHENGNANPLPALRQLPDGVDILGASCSRIMTTEKRPKPRVPVEDSLAAIREEWNIKIPPGKDRTGERAQQIRFLENLIALKKKKGHTDDVTVYAVDGEGKDFDDRKGPDFKPRKRRPPAGNNRGGHGKQSGRQAQRRVSTRNSRRQRLRRLDGGGGGTLEKSVRSGKAAATPLVGVSTLSTPTPSHWDELSSRGNEEGDEEGNYEDNENDSLGSISEESDGSAHKEDEGEDEDVCMED